MKDKSLFNWKCKTYIIDYDIIDCRLQIHEMLIDFKFTMHNYIFEMKIKLLYELIKR